MNEEEEEEEFIFHIITNNMQCNYYKLIYTMWKATLRAVAIKAGCLIM